MTRITTTANPDMESFAELTRKLTANLSPKLIAEYLSHDELCDMRDWLCDHAPELDVCALTDADVVSHFDEREWRRR